MKNKIGLLLIAGIFLTATAWANENGKLSMTHYCAIGNQPKLDLKKAENGNFEFELSPESQKLAAVTHMHALNLGLHGNELTQNWTCHTVDKPDHTTVITVKKV